MARANNYGLIVTSPENFAVAQNLGFALQGIKSRHHKKAEAMRPGDKVIYYITGVKAFTGIATITSPFFEDRRPIWKSQKEGELYPYRFKVEPDLILDEANWFPAEGIARQLEYVRKWPAENWTLAFQGNVHLISERDYKTLRGLIEKRAREKVRA